MGVKSDRVVHNLTQTDEKITLYVAPGDHLGAEKALSFFVLVSY